MNLIEPQLAVCWEELGGNTRDTTRDMDRKSMSHPDLSIGCNVRLKLHDGSTGRLLESEELHNIVTDVGLDGVRDLLASQAYPPTAIGLGTGTTAPASTDTQLEAEQYRGTITRREATGTGAIEFQLYLSTAQGNGYDYWETGLLETSADEADPGDPARLWCRAKFSAARTKTSAIELTIIWTITAARA